MSEHVLVVECSAALRVSIAFILEQEDYQVFHATNMQGAQQLLSTVAMDAAILDISRSGASLDSLIHSVELSGNPPLSGVLVLQDAADDSGVSREDCNVIALAKPFSAEGLLSAMRRVLGRCVPGNTTAVRGEP